MLLNKLICKVHILVVINLRIDNVMKTRPLWSRMKLPLLSPYCHFISLVHTWVRLYFRFETKIGLHIILRVAWRNNVEIQRSDWMFHVTILLLANVIATYIEGVSENFYGIWLDYVIVNLGHCKSFTVFLQLLFY